MDFLIYQDSKKTELSHTTKHLLMVTEKYPSAIRNRIPDTLHVRLLDKTLINVVWMTSEVSQKALETIISNLEENLTMNGCFKYLVMLQSIPVA